MYILIIIIDRQTERLPNVKQEDGMCIGRTLKDKIEEVSVCLCVYDDSCYPFFHRTLESDTALTHTCGTTHSSFILSLFFGFCVKIAHLINGESLNVSFFTTQSSSFPSKHVKAMLGFHRSIFFTLYFTTCARNMCCCNR